MINKIYNFLTKNKPVVILLVIIGAASGLYSFWQSLYVVSNINVKDSPCSNSTINQSGGTNNVNCVINPKASPIILGTNFLSQESVAGGYKIKFEVSVGNPSSEPSFDVRFPSSVTESKSTFQRGGTILDGRSLIPVEVFLFEFRSKEKVDPSLFKFYLTQQ